MIFRTVVPLLSLLAAATPGLAQEALDLDEARRRAADDGRPVLVAFHAVWCVACRRFIEDTLPDPRVSVAREGVHWVLVEIDREVSLAREYDVRATPTFILLDSDGSVRARAMGVLDPEEFVAFLEGIEPDSPPPSSQWTPLTPTPTGYRGRAICFSHVGYGPLDLSSQAPSHVLRLGLVPRTPSTLASGQWEVSLKESLANVWAVKDGEYLLDYGTLSSRLSVAHGLSDTWLVELEAQDLSRFGSILDPITIAFHDLFGLDQNGRDEVDENDNRLIIRDVDGQDIVSDESGSLVQNLSLTLQNNITCGTETLPALAWAMTVRRSVSGDELDELEGDPTSFGLSLAASRRFGDSQYGYASLGYVRHGQDEWRGLELADTQISALLAYEWRIRADQSWVVQYLFSQGAAEDRSPFDEPAHEFGFGWKHEIGRGSVLEIGLIENAITADNSPDFGIHVGFRRRF